MKNRYFLLLVTFLMTSAFGQEMLLLPPGMNALSTRDANEYLSREQSLISMIQSKEYKEISLLADDFEIWSGKNNQWQSKDRWLDTLKRQMNFNISDLTVRYLDDLAVVSFLLEANKDSQAEHVSYLIVDIWKKSTNKLKLRYILDIMDKLNVEIIKK